MGTLVLDPPPDSRFPQRGALDLTLGARREDASRDWRNSGARPLTPGDLLIGCRGTPAIADSSSQRPHCDGCCRSSHATTLAPDGLTARNLWQSICAGPWGAGVSSWAEGGVLVEMVEAQGVNPQSPAVLRVIS
jgi:hypothetical protein